MNATDIREDVEWILTADDPHDTAVRLGYTSIAHALALAGLVIA